MTNDIHPLYYVWEHRLPVYAAVLAIITAAVKTAPIPDDNSSVGYTWFYDGAHQFFNQKNDRLDKKKMATPDPPVAPGQPKLSDFESGNTNG